jgi:pyruvate kinase
MCLYRGVQPIKLGKLFTEHAIANMVAVTLLKEHHALQDGDLAIITKGDLMGTHGATNAMKIVEVGNMVEPQGQVDA